MRIRIRILLLICDPQGLHFEPPCLHFEPGKLLNFDFRADPDPAFHPNADSDLASKNNADPDPDPAFQPYADPDPASKNNADQDLKPWI
jgi:hypothetical protein